MNSLYRWKFTIPLVNLLTLLLVQPHVGGTPQGAALLAVFG